MNYINTHATSTPVGDLSEITAVTRLFGTAPENVKISATKSMTGHLGAASGAVELIYCILTMENGLIPRTINYQTVDPECDLDYVPNQTRPKKVDVTLSINQGFSGQATALIIQRR